MRQSIVAWAAALTLSATTGACVKLGPDFSQPPAVVNATWLDEGGDRLATEPTEAREWWAAFNDPILNDLVATAYRQNLSLVTAGLRVIEAQAQLGIAIGNQYPQTQQLNGNTTYQRISERSVNAIGAPEFAYSSAQVGGTLAWEFDFWGQFQRAIESADYSLASRLADYDNTLVSLTADVANNYVRFRTLQRRLSIARENVTTQQESLRIAEERFRGGTTSQRDVEQARTILGSTEATIPTFMGDLRRTTNGLSVLLGQPPSDLGPLLGDGGNIPAPPPTIAIGIPADLLRRRPDIRQAEYAAAAQSAQIGVAEAALYPAFSLTGNFGFLATDVANFSLGDIAMWKSRTGSVGPSFTWDVLNYGRLTNNVRVQDARFQTLLTTYQNTVLTAQREVEDALASFVSAQSRAMFLAESAQAAKRSLELAIIQYREGLVDFTTVLTAQQDLLQQEDSLAVTIGDISLSAVGIYRALGGGWQVRDGEELIPQETRTIMAKRTDWGNLLNEARATAPLPPDQQPIVRAPQW